MSGVDLKTVVSASLSDTGQFRAANQDACGILDVEDQSRLFIVADGMGGHQGGETASRMVVESFAEVFREAGESPERTLREAFARTNDRIYQTARRDVSLAGMGTTAVALLLRDRDTAWWGHVGDSRIYRLRGGHLEQLTQDHSLVAAMRERGLLSEAEAATDPRRNQILRSLGVEAEVEIDLARVDPEPGDCFLLCSDGLSSAVPDDEIATVLRRSSPADAARILVDMANSRGGTDNVTVVIVQLAEGAGRSAIPDPLRASSESVAARRRARAIRRVLLAVAAVGGALLGLLGWLWWSGRLP